ncbi:unnamed protein product [Ambrosiozyma monospora]|uniref:Unnamed protein product n=1 Tax=Ambrosiozyma monospora TaxID=43982 RepID=A0ACB5TAI3_AMBMO|nr:unnamed protein product [Ambrosiozyma monospora]
MKSSFEVIPPRARLEAQNSSSASSIDSKKDHGFKGAFKRLFKSNSTPSQMSSAAYPGSYNNNNINNNNNMVSNDNNNSNNYPSSSKSGGLAKAASISRFGRFSISKKHSSSSDNLATHNSNMISNKAGKSTLDDISDVDEHDDVLSFEVGDERKKAPAAKSRLDPKHGGPKKILDKDGDEFIIDNDLAYLTNMIALEDDRFLGVAEETSSKKETKKSSQPASKLAEKSIVDFEIVNNGNTFDLKEELEKFEKPELFEKKKSISRNGTIEKKKSLSRHSTLTTRTNNSDNQSVSTKASKAMSFEVEEADYDLSYYYKHYKERHLSDDCDEIQIITNKKTKKPVKFSKGVVPKSSCLKPTCSHYDQREYDPRFSSSTTSLNNTTSASSGCAASHHSSTGSGSGSDFTSTLISRSASPSSSQATSNASQSKSLKSVNFSNIIYLNDTFSQEDYNRYNQTLKQSYSYLHSHPIKVRDIRIELNTFKQYDMPVHELSRCNTHFFHN